MKVLRLIVFSSLILFFSGLTGGLASAGSGTIDPVKTCGVGPTGDIIAIDQLWDAYAHNLDSGDAEGVADLFTDGGGTRSFSLFSTISTTVFRPISRSI
jgi:hypothetical protein